MPVRELGHEEVAHLDADRAGLDLGQFQDAVQELKEIVA